MALLTWLVVTRLTTPADVRVPGAPVTLQARRLCPHLVDALPHRLGGLAARHVVPAGAAAAAWGDPPVVLRCGVAPLPAAVGQLVTLDGVDWATAQQRGAVTWTTVGRQANVQVVVPAEYDSQGPLLAGLSPVLVRTIPAR